MFAIDLVNIITNDVTRRSRGKILFADPTVAASRRDSSNDEVTQPLKYGLGRD